MYTVYRMNMNDLDDRFVEALRDLFKDKEVEITVTEIDETHYLLQEEANRSRLLQAVKNIENGQKMTQSSQVDPNYDAPSDIGKPALRALTAAGYTRLDQFTAVTEADILRLHGVGPKAVDLIRSALAARGLAFATPAGT